MLREALRMLRFGFVGIATTLIYGAIAYLAVRGGFTGPLGAAALGYLAAFLVSYFGHMYFSFAVTPDHRTHLWRFIVLTAAMFALSLVLTWTVTGPLQQANGVSVVVVMLAIPPSSYLFNRFWVFLPGLGNAPTRD
jgi:putative flippase GtrA